MSGFSRADRVAVRIQQLLSELLLRDISDPRLRMTTITQVRVTKDLRIARVYFATGAGLAAGADEALHGFRSAAGFIKRQLAPQLGLRYMPEFEFFHDASIDRGDRIDQLLKSISADTDGTDSSED
jgi:ribosome-binding factor A